jgi:O-antigen/teichoic acid export membrane protein
MGLGILYGLFITPIVIRALDTQQYGAWSFLDSLLGYSELFYLGLGSAIIRFVAQARVEDNRRHISRVTSVVLSIYSAIGLGCLLILVGVSGRLPTIFPDQLAPELARAITYTCVLLGFRLVLVFVTSAFSGLLCGHDRYDLVNSVTIGAIAVRFVAVPLLIQYGTSPLLMFAGLVLAVSLLEAIAMVSISFWYVPGLSVRLTRPTAAELKLLYGFGLQSFFVLVAFKLISYTDTTVISVKLGLVSAGLYAPSLRIVEYARQCVGGLAGVLLPRLMVHATRSDLPSLREAYLSSARVACFIAGWLAALVMTLGPAFLTRWVGPEFGNASRMVLVWLSIAAFAQALSTQIPFPFYQALHLLRVPAVVLVLEALCNLGLSLWLAPRMGIEGVALATAIPAVLLSLTVLPVYLYRRLGLSVRTVARTSVLPGVMMLVITLGAEVLLKQIIVPDTYVRLALLAALSGPIALAVFLAAFPRDDRHAIVRSLRWPLRQAE